MRCLVAAGKHINDIRAIARQRSITTKHWWRRCFPLGAPRGYTSWPTDLSLAGELKEIIIVLKSVAKTHLVKMEDFYVSCDYSENWSVWFSGTVIFGCGGNL
jgi:hypothetical protein